MLEKSSIKLLSAASLGSVLLLAFVLSTQSNALALDSGDGVQALDKFGIEKIYPTKDGREWYVNMDDPRNDPFLKNIGSVNFVKNADGSWKISNPSRGQIRMEAWSPANEKWHNVEITGYAKIISGSNELIQWYSRGGHHTSSNECLGSAYKARLYGDGRASWTKEVTHPAYAGNRGVTDVTNDPLQGRWVGFKAVIYNFEVNGKTYVRLESYVDDKVTDAAGNLVVGNNWKLASVVEDRGGWRTDNSDFNSSCGKARDAILTAPGGSGSQNIAAFRSDGLVWSFKYLNVREIDPMRLSLEEQQSSGITPSLVEDAEKQSTDYNADDSNYSIESQSGNNDLHGADCSENDIRGCTILASQHFPDGNDVSTFDLVVVHLQRTAETDSDVDVAIVRDGKILASEPLSTMNVDSSNRPVNVWFEPAVSIDGKRFDLLVLSAEENPKAVAAITGWQYESTAQ